MHVTNCNSWLVIAPTRRALLVLGRQAARGDGQGAAEALRALEPELPLALPEVRREAMRLRAAQWAEDDAGQEAAAHVA